MLLSTPSLGITRGEGLWPMSGCSALLSTPSLGITSPRARPAPGRTEPSFQLPLSGSHHLSSLPSFHPLLRKPTFNSLSRDHCVNIFPVPSRIEANSFNSLSRDHKIDADKYSAYDLKLAFNSLSRDHLPPLSGVALVDDYELSTPSLGIT